MDSLASPAQAPNGLPGPGMTEPVRPLHYRSYLLRIWEERSPPDRVPNSSSPIGWWRFSLEDPHSGARLGFADFDQLIAFLKNQIQSNSTEEASQ
jgi:hypothetical protein